MIKIYKMSIYSNFLTFVFCFKISSDYSDGTNFLAFNPKVPIMGSYWLHLTHNKSVSRFVAWHHVASTSTVNHYMCGQAKSSEAFDWQE